ncbi:MAG: hypothetical protein KF782_10475 [Labilithrix sp.]|nr:hypothetical protein [Labilithrix sp.]
MEDHVQIPVYGVAAIRAAARFGTTLFHNGYVTTIDGARRVIRGRVTEAEYIYTRLNHQQFAEWTTNA